MTRSCNLEIMHFATFAIIRSWNQTLVCVLLRFCGGLLCCSVCAMMKLSLLALAGAVSAGPLAPTRLRLEYMNNPEA
jgi:hypothetical protein